MDNSINLKKLRRDFGMVVRRKRHKIDMSQEALAENADIHRTYISSIELGKVDVGLGVAYKIAQALSTPLNKLIKEAENNL